MHLVKKGPLNVLLVSPKTPESFWGSQNICPFVLRKCALPPLSLITVAALLPRYWKIRLVDLNIESLKDRDIKGAHVVMTTGMYVERHSIAEILDRCHRFSVPTVVGGPFASSNPDALEFRLATAKFIGEAEDESTLARLITDVENDNVRGTYFAAKAPDITKSPTPRYDLLRRHAYVNLSFQVSRGCPRRCDFCDVARLFGNLPRYKTPEQVKAELTAILATGYRGRVFIVDDNFIGNRRVAKATVEAILSWQAARQSPLQYYIQADVDLAQDDDLLSNMAEAGFNGVFLGLETPSHVALEGVGKKQNTKIDMPDACQKLRHYGLEVYGGFIVGFDSDGPDCFDAIMQFAAACGVPLAMAGVLTAFPGTRLYERLREEGRLLPDGIGETFGCTNVQPKSMTYRELLGGFRRLIERLYDPKEFFSRAVKALEERVQKKEGIIGWREYYALARSFVAQGILAPYRRHYWRFVRKFWRTKKIGRAIALAIFLHHFFLYTRGTVLPGLDAELAKK